MRKCSMKSLVRKTLKRIEISAVAFKEGEEIVLTFGGSGIRPIFDFVRENAQQLDKYAGLYWGDRVVGKASALILLLIKPTYIYGKLMSEEAIKVFKEHEVPFGFGKKVPYIMNMKHDGMCPFEKAVLDIDAPLKALQKIGQVFENFKKK